MLVRDHMASRSRVVIREEGAAKLSNPTLIVGVPEIGLVGTIASSYLVQQLKLPEIGFVDSELVPQVVVVHESQPKHPIRIFGKDEMAVLLAETPLTPRLAYELAGEVTRWSKEKGARMILGITGIPSSSRETADEPKSNVFAITNSKKVSDMLRHAGVQIFEEGLMVGTYASILSRCMLEGQTNLTLLAESHQQFPDPGAAASVIEVLGKLLSIEVDIKPLLEESEEIRVKSRELMSTTQAMTQGPQGPRGIYK